MAERLPCSQIRTKAPTNFARDGGCQLDAKQNYDLSVDVDKQLAWCVDLERRKIATFPFWAVEHFVPMDPGAAERAAEKRGPGRPRKEPTE